MPEDNPGFSEDPAPAFDLFEEIDDAEDERRIAEADADIAAGRVISHEAMLRWIKSWGTPDELPPPQCGE